MNYSEFVNAVEERLGETMSGDNIQVSLYTTLKNNGKERTGVLIEKPGINISPTIYLEEYYESFLRGVPVESIVQQIHAFYKNIRQDESWNYDTLICYEEVKDKIVFKLINTEKNQEFLSMVPHMEILDLSVVFYVLLDVTEDGTAAMTISQKHAEQWEINTLELWKAAVENVVRLLPAEFFTMRYALKDLFRDHSDESFCEENLLEEQSGESDGMYVLSNRIRSYGAACIVYPHIAEMIGEILGTDFYVLPSSVHEVIILPVRPEMCCCEMEEMVSEINRTQVAEEEVLSDHVYLYDRTTKHLSFGVSVHSANAAG